MGEVLRFPSRHNEEPKKISCDVVLNRPDLVELAIEGVKGRLQGEIVYSTKGSKIIKDQLCAEMEFVFDSKKDMRKFMNTYNNFVNDAETFAFSANGIVDINNETYIVMKELYRNGISKEDIESLDIEVHNGFLVASGDGLNDSYISEHDFMKLIA